MIYCIDTLQHSLDFRPEYFQSLWDIYIEAIPKSERKSEEELATILDDPNYIVILIIADTRVIGFLIGYIGKRHDFILLEYMAVAQSKRSGGYGGLLINILKKHRNNCDIIIEVDSPREQAPDIDQRRRRICFYERQGARIINGLQYILPMDVEGHPPSDMDLMIISLNNNRTISRIRLKNILADIYSSVYLQGREDLRIDKMLEYLPVKIKY